MISAPVKADNTGRGIALIVAATMVFSIQDVLTKELVQSYPVLQVLWIRYIFFAAFALALSLRSRPLRTVLHASRPVLQIARSVVMLMALTGFALAVRHVPLADAHAIIAAAPLFATGLGVVWLGERVGVRRWLAVLAGFAGVLLVLRPGFSELKPALLLVTGSAVFYAVYSIVTRIASRDDDGETMLLYMAVTGVVPLTFVGPLFWVAPTGEALVLMVALALAGTVGHYFLIKSLEAAPASLIQPFNYLMLVWAMVNGYVVFGDFPDLWTLTGSAVIVASGLFVIYRERVGSLTRSGGGP